MRSVTLDWVQIAATAGAIQGVILAAVLFGQRTNQTANRLLATLMATMAVYLAAGPYYRAQLIYNFPHFFAVSYQGPWVFGPLVYVYARAASDRSWRFTYRALLHFVPVAITILFTMPIYMMSGAEKIATWERWRVEGMDGPITYLDPFKYVLGVGYSAATMLYLVRHRRTIENSYSSLERVNLRWLLWLTAATGGIWILVSSLKLAQVSTAMRDSHVAITMALLVYSIGYLGLKQPEVFRFEREAGRRSDYSDSAEQPPRYDRTRLDSDEAAQLKATLMRLMDEEQPWKDSELTLPDLATMVGSTPHKVSAVLNSDLQQTFYEFVNGYRVREVQRRIRAGDSRSLKILALAMDAGFASKSAFNDVFKKHTNLTPSAFRQSLLKGEQLHM